MALLCKMVGHKPDKTRVWNDGIDFRAPCIRCGIPMLRDDRKGWCAYDPAHDDMPGRKSDRHEKG